MSGKEKVMAVLMGPVEVRQTFRDWPEKMCLAVCLMESGDCQLIVFHQGEAEVFPARLQAHLRLSPRELCFFPAVPGYASRTLLYSDERRLLALVAEAPEIVEEASDYAVNYAFAQEEGLDPAVFLGVEAETATTGADRAVVSPDPAAFVSCRGKTEAEPSRSGRVRKALLPGFMQRTTPTPPGPRFRSARELALTDMPPVSCNIRPEENGWILVERVGGGGADIRIGDPDLIYLRDDRSVVAIRLEPPWDMTSPLPGRIWIRARSLPRSLRMVFADGAGAGEMTGTGAFLYLRPEPAADGPSQAEVSAAPEVPEVNVESESDATPPVEVAPDVAAPVPGPSRRRYRRRLLALTGIAAALVLVQVGLQLGELSDPGSLGAEAPIDWDRFRSAWQAARAG